VKLKPTRVVIAALLICQLFVLLISCGPNGGGRLSPGNFFSGMYPLDYLSAEKYRALNIEVISGFGYTPSTSDFDSLNIKIRQFCNKPSGVTVTHNVPVSGLPSKLWTNSDLFELEGRQARLYSTSGTLVLHLLYVPGYYASSPKTTGAVTIGPRTIAFFPDLYAKIARSDIILIHEFGHVLGLCNNGTPMQTRHEDPDNNAHCDNPNCIMYYMQLPGQYDFDTNCQLDLYKGAR
jgi:hypothetical protein